MWAEDTHDALDKFLVEVFTKAELLRWLSTVDPNLIARVNQDVPLATVAHDVEQVLRREGLIGQRRIWRLLVDERPQRAASIWRLASERYGVRPDSDGASIPASTSSDRRWRWGRGGAIRRAAIGAAVVVVMGLGVRWVWILAGPTTTVSRSPVAQRMVTMRVEVLIAIADAATEVAQAYRSGDEKAAEAQRRYEKAYWSHVAILDEPSLVDAMDDLRHELRYFESGYEPIDGRSPSDVVIQKAHAVSLECRKAIDRLEGDHAR